MRLLQLRSTAARVTARRLAAPLLAAALAGSGCAYVGQAAFEAKRDSLDHDGDGSPYGGPDRDCNDFEALESPSNDEVPYDGFDNDCDGVDVVDADGDGYPGILKEDYLALNPDAKWPSSVQEGPLDCADDVTVWPDAAQIYPNNLAPDAQYDGKDSDCAGDNDFDADTDGWVPENQRAAFEQYVIAWGLTALGETALFGDCNDFRSAANAGVTPAEDAWYDGHDDDCAGNNDFDADADGYMPDEDVNAQAYAEFLDTYHPDGAPWTQAWGDCLDQDLPNIAAAAADVWPTNPTDTPYDGIDSDCACDNDYDADMDGFMPDSAANPNAFDAYVADWSCTLVATYGDCDDDDPLTAPGSLERLGDNDDSDCDGNDDGTPFGFGNQHWSLPRAPTIIRTDDHYLVLTAAQWSSPDGLSIKEWAGLALPFERTAGFLAETSVVPAVWVGGGQALPIGLGLDAEAVGMDIWAATSYRYDNGNGYISLKTLGWLATQYAVATTEWDLIDEDYFATSVDMVLDANNHAWTLACGTDTIQILRGDNVTATTAAGGGIDPSPLDPDGIPAGVCFWNGTPTPTGGVGAWFGTAEVVVCEPAVDCTMYDYDAFDETLTLSATQPWAGRQLDYGEYRNGWHFLKETGVPGVRVETGATDMVLLGDFWIGSVDVDGRDTDPLVPGDEEVYVAAIAEPVVDDGFGPRVVVSYGPIGGPYEEIVMPHEHPTRDDLVVDGVGVYADEDRLVVSVASLATDPVGDPGLCLIPPGGMYPDACMPDALGWVFFGLP